MTKKKEEKDEKDEIVRHCGRCKWEGMGAPTGKVKCPKCKAWTTKGPLPRDEEGEGSPALVTDILREVMQTMRIGNKQTEAVIKLFDARGDWDDLEGLAELMKRQGIENAAIANVLELWAAKRDLSIPKSIQDRLGHKKQEPEPEETEKEEEDEEEEEEDEEIERIEREHRRLKKKRDLEYRKRQLQLEIEEQELDLEERRQRVQRSKTDPQQHDYVIHERPILGPDGKQLKDNKGKPIVEVQRIPLNPSNPYASIPYLQPQPQRTNEKDIEETVAIAVATALKRAGITGGRDRDNKTDIEKELERRYQEKEKELEQQKRAEIDNKILEAVTESKNLSLRAIEIAKEKKDTIDRYFEDRERLKSKGFLKEGAEGKTKLEHQMEIETAKLDALLTEIHGMRDEMRETKKFIRSISGPALKNIATARGKQIAETITDQEEGIIYDDQGYSDEEQEEMMDKLEKEEGEE